MNTRLFNTHLSFAALLLTALFVAGCGTDEGVANTDATSSNVRTVRVETQTLQPTTFEDGIRLTGTIAAPDDATLSALSSGTLTQISPLGEFVKAGQTVAQIDPTMARAALRQAEAQVASAQAQYELAADNLQRQEGLYQDSIISAVEFQNIKAQLKQAEAGLEQVQATAAQSREQLNFTRIVTPFSGTVEEQLAERGEQVSPGMSVIRIVDARHVQVKAGVPERYAGDIEVGTEVMVRPTAYGMQSFIGKVTFVGAAVNPDNRTFPIEIALDNPSGKLKPEMVARLTVTRQKMEQVLVIPYAAVVQDEAGNNVYVIAQSATPSVERRSVTLGPVSDGKVVITSGLKEGEDIVVLGQNNLTTGDLVEVVDKYSSADGANVLSDASVQ